MQTSLYHLQARRLSILLSLYARIDKPGPVPTGIEMGKLSRPVQLRKHLNSAC
jgi:hypothetical protein